METPVFPHQFVTQTPPPQVQDAMVAAKDTTYASHLSIATAQTIEIPSESEGHRGLFRRNHGDIGDFHMFGTNYGLFKHGGWREFQNNRRHPTSPRKK